MSMASQVPDAPSREPFMDAEFDLSVLGAALWRNRRKVLWPTILMAILAFAVVTIIPPKYLSESRVLIVGRDNVFLRPDVDKDIADRVTIDQEAVTSQVQLILSRDLAREVIAKLKLNELPEFDPARGGVSLIKGLLGTLGITKNPMRMTPEERTLDAYYARLNVYPVEKSRVIVIDFMSQNPELAARVANAIADAYIERQRAATQEQASAAGEWLSGQIESMRKKVADSEARVEAFRAKSNLLVGPNGTTLSAQQLGDLNGQLAAARTLKVDAEAKSRIIRQMLKSGEPIESSDILNSELIRRLSEQRVTLTAQLAEQSSSLLGNHPRIKELKAQIDDLNRQIRREAETMARSFENDAKLADARVEAQMLMFDQFKSQAASTNEQDVHLRALERDAKSQRDLLESYLAKYREASARDSIASAPADARVISRATVSNVPAYPKKLPTVLIVTLATLLVSSGVVLTREFLGGPRPETAEISVDPLNAGVERPPGVGPFARMLAAKEKLAARAASAIKGMQQTAEPGQPAPVGIPISVLEDFAHHLHAEGVPNSQIAIFGTEPHLDRIGVAIKFSRALAREARVVLIGLGSGDAAINEIAADPFAPGLAELVAGTASFGDIIARDRFSGLNLILSGRAPATRAALLKETSLAQSFKALSAAYAHVVIDAGVLGAGAAEAIARFAPHAILLVENTADEGIAQAYQELLQAGFHHVTIFVIGPPEATAASAEAA
ncbi:MAG TPA: exopolysaccharide transport family protein [Xanthobacteraceae bacterium]